MKDAKVLKFYHEVNKRLIKPDDDNGYQRMIYDIYRQTVNEYTKCTISADSNAVNVTQSNFLLLLDS